MNLVVLSSAYVSDEMQVEFGKIPPCFLPLGGRYLFESQIELIESKNLFITLPEQFELNFHAQHKLKKAKANIIRLKSSLSLGEAFSEALKRVPKEITTAFLFGDTIIEPVEIERNVVGVSEGIGYYPWSVFDRKKRVFSSNTLNYHSNEVLNGFFVFDGNHDIRKELKKNKNDFILSLNSLLNKKKLDVKIFESWLDFGHLNTYFRSKKDFLTQRIFNNFEYSNGFLTKSSKNEKKMKSELDWFKHLPERLKVFSPVVIKNKSNSYNIEYLNYLTLTEIYLFSRVDDSVWKKILYSCFEYLDIKNEIEIQEQAGNWDSQKKIVSRWAEIKPDAKSLLEKCLKAHKTSFKKLIEKLFDTNFSNKFKNQTIIHGDFCFSNILFDFRSERITVIDPRGCDFDGKTSITGPESYDLAKLAHSIIGRYDEIVANRYDAKVLKENYELSFSEPETGKKLREEFVKILDQRGISLNHLYAEMIGLFISMIPLHSDSKERQLAFLVNALRLKKEIKNL